MKVCNAISDDSLQCNTSAMFISKRVNREAGDGLEIPVEYGFFLELGEQCSGQRHIKKNRKNCK